MITTATSSIRSCSHRHSGMYTTSSAYTARNHKGDSTSTIPRVTHCASGATVRATCQPASPATIRADAGAARDSSRLRTHAQPPPLRSQLRLWAYPPAKKKSGITCRSQVSSHRPRVTPIGLEAWGPSGRQVIVVNTQCHMTTTRRLRARTASITTSRRAASGACVTAMETRCHGGGSGRGNAGSAGSVQRPIWLSTHPPVPSVRMLG